MRNLSHLQGVSINHGDLPWGSQLETLSFEPPHEGCGHEAGDSSKVYVGGNITTDSIARDSCGFINGVNANGQRNICSASSYAEYTFHFSLDPLCRWNVDPCPLSDYGALETGDNHWLHP